MSLGSPALTNGFDAIPRKPIALLVGPVIFFLCVGLVGMAFAPALLVHEPLLLVAMSPLFRHLALASPSVDLVPFVLVAVVRLFATDPFMYMIGREHGEDAVHWVEARSGRAARFVRWVKRAFARAGFVVLFVSPGPLVCLLAGASRMPVPVFLAVNLGGTLGLVLLVRMFGLVFAELFEAVRAFIEANILLLTLVSIALVLASVLAKRRRIARALRRE